MTKVRITWKTICVFILALYGITGNDIHAANIHDTNSIRDAIFTNYSTDILPVFDQSDILYINVSFLLRSIIDFYEPKGQLTTSIGLIFSWIDASLKWDAEAYGNNYAIRAKNKEIWTPNIVLSNPGDAIEPIIEPDYRATILHSGKVFIIGAVDNIKTICDADVTYFPFDIQKCDIYFSSWEYGVQVQFRFDSPTMDLSIFIRNGVWQLLKTEVSTWPAKTLIIATLYFKRRSLFYVLNFLAPILILVFLNTMVFSLPAESGERMGFSVTILLSIAVYLTIIAEKLPETSNPASVLSYILISYLLQSSLICIETIATLRIFHRTTLQSIDLRWIGFTKSMRCCSSKHNSKEQRRILNDVVDDKSGIPGEPTPDDTMPNARDVRVTWTDVSMSLDVLFLWLNILFGFSLAIVYFCIVYFRPV